MLFFLPVIVLIVTALTILVLYFLKVRGKYFWIIALVGSLLALVGVFLWKVHFPDAVSLLPWLPKNIFSYTPTWVVDSISWPYAIALASLGTAVILTAVGRKETDPLPWTGTLFLTAIGILAVSSGDPVTLILVWSAMDISELVVMLRSAGNEGQIKNVILAYAVRVIGMGMIIGASVLDASKLQIWAFNRGSANAGLLILIGLTLRLGVLPLHLSSDEKNLTRRGSATTLRFVSAASSLFVLARIPSSSLTSSWTPYLLVLTAFMALYAGWMWWRTSGELPSRPFWTLGMASLALGCALRGSPAGSVGWGVILVLSGALLFLNSSRQRKVLWLPLFGVWGISSLPYSLTSNSWIDPLPGLWMFSLAFLPSQALFLAGFIRHALHPRESNLESQEGWIQILSTTGLSILAGVTILLGVWGWDGALNIGIWWISLIVIILAIGLFAYSRKFPSQSSRDISQWGDVIRLEWLNRIVDKGIKVLENISRSITNTLEGEGGVFWSFLLLVLILSLLATGK